MRRLLWLWLLLPCAALADERILDYQSDILVRQDGWIEVTETITVRAEGKSIRRGIYRDYPTRYRDRFGNRVAVEYQPRSVLRDGRPEAFRSEPFGNGVRTWFGSADRLLSPGVYVYTWRYDANRMLGFFETHDELYWNVTGLGWDFPIDRASARVTFEFAVPADSLGLIAYTGRAGEQGGDFVAQTASGGAAQFATTRPLEPGEGLTVAVSWPKGHVTQPGGWQRTKWLLADNSNVLIALSGLLLMLAWYIPMWHRYGRDPEPGVIVARYEPPAGYSPASLRYVERMAYDDKTMTAAVVSLAVKGFLRIEKSGKKHLLHRVDAGADPATLAAGEKALLDALFRKGGRVELVNTNHKLIGEARQRHRASLKRDYANRYFRSNGGMNLPPAVIAVAAALIALGIRPSPLAIALVVIMVIVIVVFAILMKRPTGLGRKLLDEAAGFREYLEIAEKDELNLRNPPQKTPQLFERYLPFALALGVEQQWAERFAAVFASLRGDGGSTYHPAWYSGSWQAGSFSRATSSLTSGLGSAISSSVTAPGSSSGSSGGGSSGGGGGGGGGGGW